MRDVTGPIRNMVNTVDASVAGNSTAGWKDLCSASWIAEKRYQLDGNVAGCLSRRDEHNIDQATSDLRETLEQMEIRTLSWIWRKSAPRKRRVLNPVSGKYVTRAAYTTEWCYWLSRLTLKTELTPTQRDHLNTINVRQIICWQLLMMFSTSRN